MNHRLRAGALPVAVIVFCAWQSRDLAVAWQDAPFDRWGWLSFLVWLVPVGWALATSAASEDDTLLSTALALGLAVLGWLTDLNAVSYAALAVALGTLVPPSAARMWWLLGAFAWMPAFGWLARRLDPSQVAVVRLLLAGAASAGWLFHQRRVRTL